MGRGVVLLKDCRGGYGPTAMDGWSGERAEERAGSGWHDGGAGTEMRRAAAVTGQRRGWRYAGSVESE